MAFRGKYETDLFGDVDAFHPHLSGRPTATSRLMTGSPAPPNPDDPATWSTDPSKDVALAEQWLQANNTDALQEFQNCTYNQQLVIVSDMIETDSAGFAQDVGSIAAAEAAFFASSNPAGGSQPNDADALKAINDIYAYIGGPSQQKEFKEFQTLSKTTRLQLAQKWLSQMGQNNQSYNFDQWESDINAACKGGKCSGGGGHGHISFREGLLIFGGVAAVVVFAAVLVKVV